MKKLRIVLTALILIGIFAGIARAGLFDGSILTKANKYYEQGEYDEAMKEYRRLRDSNPENALAYYGMASVWYAVKNYGWAIDRYIVAVTLEPKFAAAYYWLGNACWKAGKRKDAVKYWKECLKIDPRNNDARLKLKRTAGKK